jgi:antibiotic biosynthesis monooxygenase (ABM) superfamily enzyme
MVKHIVAWNVKEEFAKEKVAVGLEAKSQLEALVDAVPGIISIKVIVNEMESSTVDVTLICEFESKEVLGAYQVCPQHVKAAQYIKTHMCNRTCIDYEE